MESQIGAGMRDQITDFLRGTVSDQAFDFAGQTAAARSVWYVVKSTGVLLRGNITGDGLADFGIGLDGLSALAGGDLVL